MNIFRFIIRLFKNNKTETKIEYKDIDSKVFNNSIENNNQNNDKNTSYNIKSEKQEESRIVHSICPNCNYKKDIPYNLLFSSEMKMICKCDKCQCEWRPTWKELGVNAEDLHISILNNPNPININFGTIKTDNYSKEMLSISLIYDIIEKYKFDKSDYRLIQSLLDQCIISENNFKMTGYEPSPRKYLVIADKARNAAAFEVEHFIYKYLLQFFELHKINMKDDFGYYGSRINYKEITDKFNYSDIKYTKEYRPSNIEIIDINKNKKTKLVDQCLKNNIDIEIIEIECDEYRKVFLDSELNYYSSDAIFIQKNILKNYKNIVLYGIESLSLIIKAHILEYLENISKNIVNNIPIEGLYNYDSPIETNIEDGKINISSYMSKKEDFIGRKLIDQINMYDFNINDAIKHIYKVDNDLLLKNLNIIHSNDIIKQLYPYSDPNILYSFAINLDKNIIVELIKYINDNRNCISSFPSIIYQDEKNSLHCIFIKGNRGTLSEQEINIINIILNKFLIHSKVIRVKTKLTSLIK